MSVQFEMDIQNFERAVTRFAELKKKSDPEVVNKAMRYLLPFAGAKVRALTPGVRKVSSDLRKRSRNEIGHKFKRSKGSWSGTLAAALVAARLKKHGRLNIKSTPRAEFWAKVEHWVEKKRNSTDYLRSGFIPAYRAFNIPNKTGKHRYFKGHSIGLKAEHVINDTVEAFARNAREGTMEIAPNAFRDALPEVTRQFLKWIDEDTARLARQSGFYGS